MSAAILANIYDPNPGTPTATVDFAVNNQNASSTWVAGNPADPLLSAVSVFDRPRSWYVDGEETAVDVEIAFLKSESYLCEVAPRLQTLTAFTRFSGRV